METEASEFVSPQRTADLVLKGGVTSGVVYPLAICEMAKTYALASVAGTSAGAIGAGFAAAAEYRRRQGDGGGFVELAGIPAWLGEDGRMLQLFRPDTETKALFSTVTAAARPGGGAIAAVRTALSSCPLVALFGVLPGVLLVSGCLIAWSDASSQLNWLGWICLLALGVVVVLVGLVIAVVLQLKSQLQGLRENCMGLCSGMQQPPRGEAPSLSNWLHDRLQSLSGLPAEKPLTFGDLWGAPPPRDGEGNPLPHGERSIQFESVTTNLTQGQPHRLPFVESTFYFDPEELEQLFPKDVVAWMVEHARKQQKPCCTKGKCVDVYSRAAGGGVGKKLCRLPITEDLPVLLAVRMSLSFPLLLSAVPLHAVHYGRQPKKDWCKEGHRIADRCWFSDGGITSNFPIHFFDQLVPRWPTFGINLASFPWGQNVDADSPEEQKVFLPSTNNQSTRPTWIELETDGRAPTIGAFLSAILGAMQNWYDASFLQLPGYRTRVASVFQSDSEGGLNLNMGKEPVRLLAARGQLAGEALVKQFTTPASEDHRTSWDDHRWTRYRSSLAALQDSLQGLAVAMRHGSTAHPPLVELIRRPAGTPPLNYPLTKSDAEFVQDLTDRLLELGDAVAARASSEKNVPKPRAPLGLKPDMR